MKQNVNNRLKIFKQGKYKYFEFQKRKFFEYLTENTATCSMACAAIGIPQKNATRYKRQLENEGKLVEVLKSVCRNTGYRAAYLTTNETLIKSLVKW